MVLSVVWVGQVLNECALFDTGTAMSGIPVPQPHENHKDRIGKLSEA